MKKYQILLLMLTIFLYLFISYLSYTSLRDSKKVRLRDNNLTVVDIKKRVSINSKDIYASNFKLWDLEINDILEKRQKKEKESTKLNLNHNNKSLKESVVNISSTKRKICLNKKCWEFMGMVTINNQTQVTLLSIDEKPKLEIFRVKDELLSDLIITKIEGDNMIVTYKKDKKEFILKLFEVNASAYSVKTAKEVNE